MQPLTILVPRGRSLQLEGFCRRTACLSLCLQFKALVPSGLVFCSFFLCFFLCLLIYRFVCSFVCLFVCLLSVCLSVNLFVCVLVCVLLFVDWFSLFVCLFACASEYSFDCLFDCSFVYLKGYALCRCLLLAPCSCCQKLSFGRVPSFWHLGATLGYHSGISGVPWKSMEEA